MTAHKKSAGVVASSATPAVDSERLRQLAEDLGRALESGDHQAAEQAINALADSRQERFVTELARCVRNLHGALHNFQFDGRLAQLSSEIPDAKDRLNYVITLTEQAADRSLTVVEAGMPVVEDLKRQASDLATWLESDVPCDLLRSAELEFVHFAGAAAERLGQGLNEVLMAQEFQDLTGQVIRRVIELVQEVEDGLVQIIKATQPALAAAAGDPGDAQARMMRGEGPQVPDAQGRTKGDVYNSQDEVDDLLASLGF